MSSHAEFRRRSLTQLRIEKSCSQQRSPSSLFHEITNAKQTVLSRISLLSVPIDSDTVEIIRVQLGHKAVYLTKK